MHKASGDGEGKKTDRWSLDELQRLIERRNKEAWRSEWGRRRRERDADRTWYEGCYTGAAIPIGLVMAYLVYTVPS